MQKLLLIVGCAASVASSALADPDDALSRELLADAGARASFRAGGTAGHDGKFFLASADGANRLSITGQAQFRYNVNSRDTSPPDEDVTNGFNARRTKLGFEGRTPNAKAGKSTII